MCCHKTLCFRGFFSLTYNGSSKRHQPPKSSSRHNVGADRDDVIVHVGWFNVTVTRFVSELHAPAAQCSNPAGDSSRRQGGGQAGWVVAPTGALMTWTHFGRLLHGHSRSSVAVYLLFPVAQPDFLQRTRCLLAVSALLWDFMLHLETRERWYDKHDPLRAPWPPLTPPASLAPATHWAVTNSHLHSNCFD